MLKSNHRKKRFTGFLLTPLCIAALVLSFIGAAGALGNGTSVGQASAASGGMNFYFGNLHSHTYYSDGTGFPAEAFTWARDTAEFDFYAITDHAERLSQAEWEDIGVQAEIFNAEGEFLALRGFEWSHPNGHINVFGTDDYTDSHDTNTLDSLYEWIDARGALAQFNHPGREPYYFNGFEYDHTLADNFCLFETGNWRTGNNDGVHYEQYPTALDRGWRLAAANNQDNHSLRHYSNRTVIVSPELTRDALYDALGARRVYSSDDPDMRVTFKQGSYWMGSVVENCGENVQFDVTVEDDENIASLELVTNNGVTAAKQWFDAGEDTRQVTWNPTVSVQGNSYFYLRVVERDQNGEDDMGLGEQVAVTAPIWLEVEGTNWYLAEGSTAGEFETWVLVQNPNNIPAQVTLTFLTENGPVPGPAATLDPNTRLSFNAGEFVTSFHVSTKVESNQPVVAERAVYWNNRTGGHDSIGAIPP
jgi:predicted metal-dependent phosphoesterase TrpH